MKCSQEGCDEVASFTYVWPGRAERAWACEAHLFAAKRIADACDFGLGDLRVCTPEEAIALATLDEIAKKKGGVSA